MQLIIAEKPSVARDLARVLGARKKHKSFIEGDGSIITWCIGHLVELEEPKAYDERWKSWRFETLPMIPKKFQLRPSSFAKAQYNAVKALLRDQRFSFVINACDAGREGELIFRYVYELSRSRLPIKRLWISSLTDEAIREGFSLLQKGEEFDALANAARCRSEADWLVGLNATRGLTIKSRTSAGSTLFSIGRVQTPTLGLIVAKEDAIKNFVPQDYWEVHANFFTKIKEEFSALWKCKKISRLGKLSFANQIIERCQTQNNSSAVLVEKVQKKIVKEAPPSLFDLSSLQRTANRRFGFSAAKTLEVAQALYEKQKAITYPRTDSRYLSNDLKKELSKIFHALEKIPSYKPFAAHLLHKKPKMSKRVFDDSKIQDHHAIIPTGKSISLESLSKDELRIFDLIVRRFLGVFYPSAEFAVTEITVIVGEKIPHSTREKSPIQQNKTEELILEKTPPAPDRFFARGRIRLVAGWQEVANFGKPGKSEKSSVQELPLIKEGDLLTGTFRSLAKKTSPPPRYTEASLLSAMEYAGRTIKEDALRTAMKDCGLGTPATRASIIETLLKREYILRDKKTLIATETGMALIGALPHKSLCSPELTGEWEARLARIARKEETRENFMKDIVSYLKEIIEAIRAQKTLLVPQKPSSQESIGTCPLCNGNVVETSWSYACSQNPCKFSLGKKIAKRNISNSLAKVLLSQKQTKTLSGFTSKAGKPFQASLQLKKDGSLQFIFDKIPFKSAKQTKSSRTPVHNKSKPDTEKKVSTTPQKNKDSNKDNSLFLQDEEKYSCPNCQRGTIIAGKRGWGCTHWRQGCGFVIWFQTAGKTLTATQLRDLLTKGKTRKSTFYPNISAEQGRLILTPNLQGGAVNFEPC